MVEEKQYNRDSIGSQITLDGETATEPELEVRAPTSIKLPKSGMSDVDGEIVATDRVPTVKLGSRSGTQPVPIKKQQPGPSPLQQQHSVQRQQSPPTGSPTNRPLSGANITDFSWLLGPAKVYREDDLAAVKYTSERVGEHRAAKRDSPQGAATQGKKAPSAAVVAKNDARKGAERDIRKQMLAKKKDKTAGPITLSHPAIDLEISDDEGTEG